MRVVDLGQSPGLCEVRLNVVFPADSLWVWDLDGNTAIEFFILRQVDPSEPSLAEPPDYPVATDHRWVRIECGSSSFQFRDAKMLDTDSFCSSVDCA